MGYIGNQTSNSYTSITKQTITGDGGASYTLDHAVANVNEIEVFVNNVRQEPAVAYTVSGTALTMTGNVAASDSFYVVFQGKALQSVAPPDDSVTTARINDGAVTTAKLATPIGIETTSSTFKMTDLSTNAFYRKGTWTPVLISSGATDDTISIYSGTPQNQYGEYTRIGDTVNVTGRVKQTASTVSYTNGGANGQTLIATGLPFNVSNTDANYYPSGSVGYFAGWTGWGTGYTPMPLAYPNTPYIYFYYAGSNGVSALHVDYLKTSNADIFFSLTYRTDDA